MHAPLHGLFDLAGLETRSRGELLGVLLAAAKTDDPHRWAAWKQAGDAILAQKGDTVDLATVRESLPYRPGAVRAIARPGGGRPDGAIRRCGSMSASAGI